MWKQINFYGYPVKLYIPKGQYIKLFEILIWHKLSLPIWRSAAKFFLIIRNIRRLLGYCGVILCVVVWRCGVALYVVVRLGCCGVAGCWALSRVLCFEHVLSHHCTKYTAHSDRLPGQVMIFQNHYDFLQRHNTAASATRNNLKYISGKNNSDTPTTHQINNSIPQENKYYYEARELFIYFK